MKYPNRVIQKGETDISVVKSIQKRLNELGLGELKIDGDYGTKTIRAVKLFQSRNVDRLGFPLIIDGKIGPITFEILFSNQNINVEQPLSPYITALLAITSSQVGVLEIPLYSNSGPQVNKYLLSTNLGPGYAWCMAFVYWCFQEAAAQTNSINPLAKTAGCLNQWNRTTLPKINKDEAINNPSLITPGSIFIMDFGRGLGHTGIVESIEGGFINTIEGNTNTSLSRNGIGVFRNKRKINSINRGFILTS